ncbi:cell wall-binding repeat-containing protein [Candidatus Poriferisodalis sp.]|uniref:cell wall-binding repeat-containing protein n=1 Tax=Candidatus Poriferisodalis sp. TaxID=3101277 RepID=UPI003B01FA72
MKRAWITLLSTLVVLGGAIAMPTAPAAAQSDIGATAVDAGDDSDAASFVLLNLRYAGADRYETSLQAANLVAQLWGGSLESVVMISGERWTDAVVAGPLAGALRSPVLMTPPDALRDDTLDFIKRVGAQRVVIVGSSELEGPGRGVGPEVASTLMAEGFTVAWAADTDRYGTGVAVARQLGEARQARGFAAVGEMPGLGRTAIVASGEVFADALVAGPIGARGGHPILLNPPGELRSEVATYLGEADIEHVVVMGGTAAQAVSVETSIEELGIELTRLAGATRYDTAVKAAELVEQRYEGLDGAACFDNRSYGLARADVPFDSFSAAPLLGRICLSLLLTDPEAVPEVTASHLDKAFRTNKDDAAEGGEDSDSEETVEIYVTTVLVFGGEAAVSQASLDAYLQEVSARLTRGDADDTTETDAETEDDDDDDSAPVPDCSGSIDDKPSKLVPQTNAEDPNWSPDCSRLVYTDNASLRTAANDGSDRQLLVPAAGAYLTSATWSPDGERIVYVRGYQDGDRWVSHLWSVDADGTDITQLTFGDTRRDRWPRWSADGSQIVFNRLTDQERFVASINADGTGETHLTEGGRSEFSPVLSPDGTKLAYISNSTVFVANADGSNPQTVISNVFWRGELAWSPSGDRIAFARGDLSASDIYIADVDGWNEEQVSDLDGQALAPRWSPDGKRLAFHTITSDGKHRTFVSGASGATPAVPTDCRMDNLYGWGDGLVASTGTIRVAVLFVDFSDAAGDHTTQTDAALGLPYIEDYFEAASYDKLDIEFVPVHRWLRANHTAEENLGVHVAHLVETEHRLTAHALEQAADDIDFSTIDVVDVVFPSSHFTSTHRSAAAEVGGKSLPVLWTNTFVRTNPRGPSTWGRPGAQEIGFLFSLPSLYRSTHGSGAVPEQRPDQAWVWAEWGLMGFGDRFLAQRDHPGLDEVWHFADGSVTRSKNYWLNPQEMLAWNRWQLNWLDDSQMSCITDDEATVNLAPIADPGDGVAIAAIPLSAHQAIVVESRRELGYDADREIRQQDGTRGTLPNLIEEGVLVYTVDTWIRSADLPYRFAGDQGNGWLTDDPILAVGESITVQGYEITVTADDGDTHTVQITKLN